MPVGEREGGSCLLGGKPWGACEEGCHLEGLDATSTWTSEGGKPALQEIRGSLLFLLLRGKGGVQGEGRETEVAEREPARWREAQTGRGAGPGSSPIEFICSYRDVNHAFHLCNKFSIYTWKQDLRSLEDQKNKSPPLHKNPRVVFGLPGDIEVDSEDPSWRLVSCHFSFLLFPTKLSIKIGNTLNLTFNFYLETRSHITF